LSLTNAYAAEIVKAERNDDGDLIVYGKASGPELDLDSQICDPDWLQKAMPDWMTYGNVREMHQPIVAGVGLELTEDQDQWYLKSQVVDDATAKKIEAGALKGYSVGIKNAKVVKDATAPGGRIVGGDIVEVSYVDRPCNPTAMLALAKVAGGDWEAVEKAANPGCGCCADCSASCEDEAGKAVLSDEDRAMAIALVKAVNGQGEKDEAPDIDGAEHVLQLIAKLIESEAQEMAIGAFDESCDIELLTQAAQCMKCFLAKEKLGYQNDDMPDGMSYVYLAVEADLIKRKIDTATRKRLAKEGKALGDGSYPIENAEDLHNAYLLARSGHGDVGAAKSLIAKRAKELGVANPFAAKKDAEPDVTKTTEADEPQEDQGDLVKNAVAEATKSLEDRLEKLQSSHDDELKSVKAELAKVLATPIPGGPAVTGGQPQVADLTAKQAELAKWRRAAVTATDPDLKKYARDRAAQLTAELAA